MWLLIFQLSGPPPLAWSEGGIYVIRGMWLPGCLLLEGSNHFCVWEP
jgi:hypothetical protein